MSDGVGGSKHDRCDPQLAQFPKPASGTEAISGKASPSSQCYRYQSIIVSCQCNIVLRLPKTYMVWWDDRSRIEAQQQPCCTDTPEETPRSTELKAVVDLDCEYTR